MKILINTPNVEKKGGVASYYKALQHKFTEDVEYFTVGSRTDNDSTWYTLIRFLKDNWQFYQKLKKGNYDTVQLNPSLNFKAVLRDGIFLFIAKLFNKKTIVYIYGWNRDFGNLLEKYFLFLFKFTYLRADALIVQASEFKLKLIEWAYEKNVYMETGVVDEVLLSELNKNSIEKKLLSDEKKCTLLFLARIIREKGIYETIDAYKIMRKKFRFINLVVCGDGPELKNVKNYANKNSLNNIIFTGYVIGDKKKYIFEHSDIYLFPTYHGEGMPSSVLEAMAFGLPVITRPVGGLKDFFENGKMGFITRSKDPNVFADLIEKLILNKELRYRIALYNHQYAKEHFIASNVAKRIEEIHKQVLRD